MLKVIAVNQLTYTNKDGRVIDGYTCYVMDEVGNVCETFVSKKAGDIHVGDSLKVQAYIYNKKLSYRLVKAD